jgi:hypothetical protein
MKRYEFTAVLAIRHPNVDPGVLTKELGLGPQYSWRAGDPRTEEGGLGSYRESYWAANLYPRSAPPLEALGMSLFGVPVMPVEGALMLGILLLKRRHDFWKRLQSEGATGEILVAFSNREGVSFKLRSDLLSMVADLGLSVSLDVQPSIEAAA